MMVCIQQAREEDAAVIADIHVASWLVAYKDIVPDKVLDAQSVDKQQAFWAKVLKQSCDNMLVAVSAHDEIVGWISYGSAQKSAETGEVQAIYLRPEHFNKGIGRALWEAALQRLRSSGFSTVIAFVLSENDSARRFYERIGFTLVPDSDSTFNWEGESIAEVCYEYHI